jgi:hypothetical protein
MPYTEILDNDGNTHHISIGRRVNGMYYVTEFYSDGGPNQSADYRTSEEVVAAFTQSPINRNCAKRFEEMPTELQARVLAFIEEHFQQGVRGNTRQYSSYGLKHVVEKGIGTYISNGQLKGAMKQAGFPVHHSSKPADINYVYSLRKLKRELLERREETDRRRW